MFVCTGNICRSPMGEALMKARVGETVNVKAPRGVKAFEIIAFGSESKVLSARSKLLRWDTTQIGVNMTQFLSEGDRIGEVPAAVDPIGRRDPHAERISRRADRVDGFEHFQRKLHAPRQVAAIGVVTLVAQGR